MFSAMRRYWLIAGVGLAILSATLLPLNLLTIQRLHHDEALYATWALKIVSGDDPWLTETPIDKPPLYLYTLAGAIRLLGNTEAVTRIPSLMFTGLSVLLTFWLGHKLYNKGVGLLAAWLVALSPFTLLFAPTTFTDPMLVALALAGCVAAAYNKAGWSGFFLALAIATKQQGFFFVPLPVMLLLINNIPHATLNTRHILRTFSHSLAIFISTLTLTLLPALVWDFVRDQPSGFFEQSAINYGGLTFDAAGFGERWQGFVDLLYYATASPLLNLIFLGGCLLLLIDGLWQLTTVQKRNAATRPLQEIFTDWLLALFILGFLFVHALLSFQIWDRYLLGLIPFLALLFSRILLLPWLLLKNFKADTYARWQPWPALITTAGVIWLLGYTLAAPVQNAIYARYPLGSNSHALRGIEQITAYLQGHVGANNTLYHHWLGTHWRFYLWDYPYDLQYWDTPDELAAKARPGHYLAYPTWQSDTELRLALFKVGLRLHEIFRAYAPGGNPSIILYKIEKAIEE